LGLEEIRAKANFMSSPYDPPESNLNKRKNEYLSRLRKKGNPFSKLIVFLAVTLTLYVFLMVVFNAAIGDFLFNLFSDMAGQ